MTPLQFYREQAAQQKVAADAATLQNVRERCQRASDAWAALAAKSERIADQRADLARSGIGSEKQNSVLATTGASKGGA